MAVRRVAGVIVVVGADNVAHVKSAMPAATPTRAAGKASDAIMLAPADTEPIPATALSMRSSTPKFAYSIGTSNTPARDKDDARATSANAGNGRNFNDAMPKTRHASGWHSRSQSFYM